MAPLRFLPANRMNLSNRVFSESNSNANSAIRGRIKVTLRSALLTQGSTPRSFSTKTDQFVYSSEPKLVEI
jgi:hypothetical protein